jgi:flavodoxin I
MRLREEVRRRTMNVRIVYGSLTGNTRRVAEAIGKELAVLPRAAKEPQSLEGGDLLFLGSGVYGGRPAGAVRRLLSAATSLAGVKVALFGTYGGTPNQLDWMARAVQEKGGEVLGRFSCKGRDWFVLGLVARGHPSAADLSAAAAFTRQARERAGQAKRE